MRTYSTRALMGLLIVFAYASVADADPSRWMLQSNFWTSLHETLLHAAQNDSLPVQGTLDADEVVAWEEALSFYRNEYAGRLPLFDDELQKIGDRLSSAEGDEPPAELPAGLNGALNKAAPVYRRHFWPDHDRAARFWIGVAETLLALTGDELVAAHEAVYDVPFPERILVDVTPRAGRFGAYTTRLFSDGFRQVHVRISCLEAGYQGFHALEALFHEASHGIVGPSAGAIGPELKNIGERLDVAVPAQLWHAILFDTAGQLTQRALEERGVSDYVPYSEGMFIGPYRSFAQLMEHWRSHLRGEISRTAALERMLTDWHRRTREPPGTKQPRTLPP